MEGASGALAASDPFAAWQVFTCNGIVLLGQAPQMHGMHAALLQLRLQHSYTRPLVSSAQKTSKDKGVTCGGGCLVGCKVPCAVGA